MHLDKYYYIGYQLISHVASVQSIPLNKKRKLNISTGLKIKESPDKNTKNKKYDKNTLYRGSHVRILLILFFLKIIKI